MEIQDNRSCKAVTTFSRLERGRVFCFKDIKDGGNIYIKSWCGTCARHHAVSLTRDDRIHDVNINSHVIELNAVLVLSD